MSDTANSAGDSQAPSYNKQQALADRALLVRLTRKTYSPYARDDDVLKDAKAEGVGNFNKHLFKDRNSLVAQTNQRFSEVYDYHRKHTLPWVDNGPRMIRTDRVPEYKQKMRGLISEAEKMKQKLIDNWDDEVQKDLARITAINPKLAKLEDYPSAMAIDEMYAAEIVFMPVPDEEDFRVGMDAEDMKALRDAAKNAEKAATQNVIAQLIEPLQSAAEKLNTDIGEKGSIFRDSLTANIVEVAERMEAVNLSPDPKTSEIISKVKKLGERLDNKKDELRNNPTTRKKAADHTADAVNKITAAMQDMV